MDLHALHARVMSLHPSVRRSVQVHAIRILAEMDMAALEDVRLTAVLGMASGAVVDSERGERYVVYAGAPGTGMVVLRKRPGAWKHVSSPGDTARGLTRRLKRARAVRFLRRGALCKPSDVPDLSSFVNVAFKCNA